MSEKRLTDYRKGTGILLHMMRWSRPETLNAVRELSRHLKEATGKHYKQMIRVMKYCVGSNERGITFRPTRTWDGKSAMEFKISGMSDSEYMKDPTRHSVNGWACYLEGCAVNMASKMMPVIAKDVLRASTTPPLDRLHRRHVKIVQFNIIPPTWRQSPALIARTVQLATTKSMLVKPIAI